MTYCDDVYAHIDPIHILLDHRADLSSAECALLNRLCHQVCLSEDDWAALNRVWQRVVVRGDGPHVSAAQEALGSDRINAWERDFLGSLIRDYPYPSDKQLATLEAICAKARRASR